MAARSCWFESGQAIGTTENIREFTLQIAPNRTGIESAIDRKRSDCRISTQAPKAGERIAGHERAKGGPPLNFALVCKIGSIPTAKLDTLVSAPPPLDGARTGASFSKDQYFRVCLRQGQDLARCPPHSEMTRQPTVFTITTLTRVIIAINRGSACHEAPRSRCDAADFFLCPGLRPVAGRAGEVGSQKARSS